MFTAQGLHHSGVGHADDTPATYVVRSITAIEHNAAMLMVAGQIYLSGLRHGRLTKWLKSENLHLRLKRGPDQPGLMMGLIPAGYATTLMVAL